MLINDFMLLSCVRINDDDDDDDTLNWTADPEQFRLLAGTALWDMCVCRTRG